VLDAPNALIGQAVSQVFVSEGARFAASDPRALQRFFRRLLVRQALIGLVPLAIVMAAGPILFGIVFGPRWSGAGEYARLFAVMTYASFLAWPFTPTLTMLERQKVQLGWDISRMVLSIGAIEIAHRLGAPPARVLAAYVVAMAFCYLCHLVLSDWAIRERVRAWDRGSSSETMDKGEAAPDGSRDSGSA
jgi:O-antigen/teichoic acid export membrane protein